MRRIWYELMLNIHFALYYPIYRWSSSNFHSLSKASNVSTVHEINTFPENDWTSFEFVPSNESPKSSPDSTEQSSQSSEYSKIDAFFSTFHQKIDGMALIERDKDNIYRLCIGLTENIKELSILLNNENNGFNAEQVYNLLILPLFRWSVRSAFLTKVVSMEEPSE